MALVVETDSELIHLADKGPQYAAVEFPNRLADWNLRASYSPNDDCWRSALEGGVMSAG